MINIDLINLYKSYFQAPYFVSPQFANWGADGGTQTTKTGSVISYKSVTGKTYFLKSSLSSADDFLEIECSTIRINTKKTIIKTALSERRGTVKELFAIGDYQINIKGVLIGSQHRFPEDRVETLNRIFNSKKNVTLHNALFDILSPASGQIVLESLEFPAIEGADTWHVPFVLTAESDYIDTLIYKGENITWVEQAQ